MAEHWSRLECEVIVDDYVDMLTAECRQRPYSKADHRRALKNRLSNRSDGSIEYKHQNISAVLIRAGHIYVPGYKPAWNYQDLLEVVVLDRISADKQTIAQFEAALIAKNGPTVLVKNTAGIVVAAPERVLEKQIRDTPNRMPKKINYAERESRNRELGQRGEEFVVNFERKRLVEIGRDDLAGDVEWTSKVLGDGAGYDIQSFRDDTDEPLYIEVKTTNSGKYQPFLISANEVSFSNQHDTEFALYRVFDFAQAPRLFLLEGSITAHVELTPTVFSARF